MRYYPSYFCNVPIPYKNQGKIYSRTSRICTINMISSATVPYGMYGRLALVGITSLAYQSMNSKSIEFESIFSMLKDLKGRHPTGTQLEKFEEQLINWTNTTINIKHISDQYKTYKNLLLIKQGEFQLEKNRVETEKMRLCFTSDGKNFLTNNTIPLPSEVVQNIERAALFDILSWVIINLFTLKENEEKFIEWARIYPQFNVSPNKHFDFREQFRQMIQEIIVQYYPKANISVDKSRNGGVFLKESPLLITSTTSQTLYIPFIKNKGDYDGKDGF